MGINRLDLDVLIQLKNKEYIPNKGAVIEIGAQQISNDFLAAQAEINQIGKQFGAPLPHPFPSPLPSGLVNGGCEPLHSDAPMAKLFWEWLGFDYAAVDIDGSPGSIALDLNFDSVPQNLLGKYHLVTNYGTTEHVANQLNAFKIIHEFTALGGVMIHAIPAQGMLNHGLFNYNPKFFWMLARSNGYKWLYAHCTKPTVYYPLPQNIMDQILSFNPHLAGEQQQYQFADSGIIMVMQKVFNTPYVPALDVNTGTKTDNKMLKERYWSVFQENAFDNIDLPSQ